MRFAVKPDLDQALGLQCRVILDQGREIIERSRRVSAEAKTVLAQLDKQPASEPTGKDH